jgi:nucleoside-diphosphate-sugar epimerase
MNKGGRQPVRTMMNGKMPFLLKMGFDYVDVRDAADLHLLVMTRPEAAGERFLATANTNLTYKEEAKILRKHLGGAAKRVSTKEMPGLLVKFPGEWPGNEKNITFAGN